jgi:hypothetical protein
MLLQGYVHLERKYSVSVVQCQCRVAIMAWMRLKLAYLSSTLITMSATP